MNATSPRAEQLLRSLSLWSPPPRRARFEAVAAFCAPTSETHGFAREVSGRRITIVTVIVIVIVIVTVTVIVIVKVIVIVIVLVIVMVTVMVIMVIHGNGSGNKSK